MTDADLDSSNRLGELLRERDSYIATAESCTGGLIASLLTDVAGSSDYFDRGVVTYSYDAKIQVLDVDRDFLDRNGAVNSFVAREMAEGVREFADTDCGVSTTGIAGPGGGDEDTEIGEVYFGISTETNPKHEDISNEQNVSSQQNVSNEHLVSSDGETWVYRCVFDCGRREVKRAAAGFVVRKTVEVLEKNGDGD